MYAEDDDGRILKAKFTVEGDGGMIALVLSSASGPSGNQPARNPRYKDALELLLTRLKGLDAVLEDALVDTRDTRRMGLPEDERRLTSGPLRLSEQPDMRELRKQLTRGQGPIGQRRAHQSRGRPFPRDPSRV